jgi:F0F1-type ATP synthase assembly protein I
MLTRRAGLGTLLSLEAVMLVWLAVILLVAWLLGWGVFHVAGGLIHLLLVIALVVFLINFITGRRTV